MFTTTSPIPSGAGRGDLSIQPSYFTSSLFVNPLREDLCNLAQEFDKQLKAQPEAKPFHIFKHIWIEQGWSWLHLKILEPRARAMFLSVTLRLFLESSISKAKPLVHRVAGLLCLYTFYATQPSPSVPTTYKTKHVPIALDHYKELLQLPLELDSVKPSLKPIVSYILNWLIQEKVFTIIPASQYYTDNPRELPREIVSPEFSMAVSEGEGISDGHRKKTGRPSKAEKQQRAKVALTQLERWLEKSSHSNGTTESPISDEDATHVLLSQKPDGSRNTYEELKKEMLELIPLVGSGDDPVVKASERVLTRLREIDAAAAKRGLEVGTEGGENSGLSRVEKAMQDSDGYRGLLGLTDGAGFSTVDNN